MPPTRFQPSHQTPFKSTLSSSQQSRNHHSPFESASDAPLSIAHIDPSEWRYHAEGGKNVLLSFCGRAPSRFVTPHVTFALRIPKHLPRSTEHKHHEDEQEEQEEAELFTTHIVTPLLGSAAVLPQCVKMVVTSERDRRNIDTLAARIELERPSARRAHPSRIRADMLSCIYAVQDITAPGASSAADVLCVEIKPKWGFLPRVDSLPRDSPNASIKTSYSRYKMHKVAKDACMPSHSFQRLYDPLDLYSNDGARMKQALNALQQDWNQTEGKTNNLRLFWNGEVVKTHDAHVLKRIANFLNKRPDQRAFGDALTEVVVQELSKRLVPDPHSRGAEDKISILARLAYLQSSLDPYDVEGLASLWLHHTQSATLGKLPHATPNTSVGLPKGLTASLPSRELLPLLERFLSSPPPADTVVDVETLVTAVQAFLVSATFKDCSLLLRFTTIASSEESTATAVVVGETKLVDLDRKPFWKLATMHQTDQHICTAFQHWLCTQ